MLVRHLLDLIETLPLVIFGDGVILEQLLQAIVGVAPHLPNGVAPFFRLLVDVP